VRARLPLVAALVCVVLWSTTYAVTVAVLHHASPAVLSVGRFALASVALLPFAARRRGFAASLRSPWTILLALTGVALYYVFSNIGLGLTSAGTGALSAAMTPVVTAVFAVLLLQERMPPRTIAGLALATAGVVIVGGAGVSLDVGLLLCLAGLCAYALYIVLLRRRPPRVDAIALGTATTVWGTALMLPWLVLEVATGTVRWPVDGVAIGGIAYEAIIVTAPTMILFNHAAERLPAAISGITIAGIPVLGYAFALAFGEVWDPVKAIGGAVAVAGIVIATASTGRRRGSAHAVPETAIAGSAVTDAAVTEPIALPTVDPVRDGA
jgi:drug/metabolite transporter (DMT)-like permease